MHTYTSIFNLILTFFLQKNKRLADEAEAAAEKTPKSEKKKKKKNLKVCLLHVHVCCMCIYAQSNIDYTFLSQKQKSAEKALLAPGSASAKKQVTAIMLLFHIYIIFV